MVNVRPLTDADTSRVDAFLELHRDSSMFLRSNILRSGLVFEPKPFHAFHVGAFRGEELVGVAAHAWSGMLLIQAPDGLDDVVRACVDGRRRRVSGVTGPLDQVLRARELLDLVHAPASMESEEWLYGLDLDQLLIPDALRDGKVIYRPVEEGERQLLHAWRIAYDVELLGVEDNDQTRRRSAAYMDEQIERGDAWVATDQDTPVSLSAFNATLPDIVQLGGIYTPPELRGRGYAKVAVAGSLIEARKRGATRAVLFTNNPAAARSYEGIGFRRIGDYGLVIFR